MNKIDFTKIYGYLGKILCGVAGAIVAFVIGGIYWAIPGIIVGIVIGHFLGKAVVNPALKN